MPMQQIAPPRSNTPGTDPSPFREARAAQWNRLVRERVGRPLIPEELRSILFLLPTSSGDVVLATTLLRHVKARNPACHLSVAVKRSNLPLIRMCPGVDEASEFPFEWPDNTRSRRRSLGRYAGQADAVVYPICDPEDMDLMQRFNFLETIWLLAGIPDGIPAEPQELWMTRRGGETAAQVLGRCLSREHAARLSGAARGHTGSVLRSALRTRQFKNAGLRVAPGRSLALLRNARLVRRLSGRADLSDPAGKFVIVSSEANMYPAPPPGVFDAVIRFLRGRGRIVLQNVLDPSAAAPGTVPLVCSYGEFLSLRDAGIPFVGWRSGLCDVAAAAAAPMCVIHPGRFDGCAPLIQANMWRPLESFGFASMNIAANCVEMECCGAEDLDLEKLAGVLD